MSPLAEIMAFTFAFVVGLAIGWALHSGNSEDELERTFRNGWESGKLDAVREAAAVRTGPGLERAK